MRLKDGGIKKKKKKHHSYNLSLCSRFQYNGNSELNIVLKSNKKRNYNYSVDHFRPDLINFLCPQQLLQQATSTSNQGSFNGLQRLGGEFILSDVDMFLSRLEFNKLALFMSQTL